MTYPEAKQMLTGLLDAFDRDEHGDYFYENGWEVCEAVILAMGAFEDNFVAVTRCKECRYSRDAGYTCIRKVQRGGVRAADKVHPGFFCAAGKPKEET